MRGGQPAHELSWTPEWRAWLAARRRCHDPGDGDFKNYGARGIQMCARWRLSFASFYRHIGPKPGPGYSLDRIDNDGDYKPGNVRWATRSEQNANRRRKATGV